MYTQFYWSNRRLSGGPYVRLYLCIFLTACASPEIYYRSFTCCKNGLCFINARMYKCMLPAFLWTQDALVYCNLNFVSCFSFHSNKIYINNNRYHSNVYPFHGNPRKNTCFETWFVVWRKKLKVLKCLKKKTESLNISEFPVEDCQTISRHLSWIQYVRKCRLSIFNFTRSLLCLEETSYIVDPNGTPSQSASYLNRRCLTLCQWLYQFLK